jgi:hypothetical protein
VATRFQLTDSQATRLRQIARHYKPQMTTSWKRRTADQLWLRVLSQIVVAGNAAPEYTLRTSEAVKEKLAFRRLKRLTPKRRRQVIHAVLRAIGTRYVGDSLKNRKIDAALHNFDRVREAGGPRRFFKRVASMKSVGERIKFLSDTLHFYKKKGCRDILIDLRLATDCLALDRRLNRIMECVGARVPRCLNRHYEEIETELIKNVAKPCGFSGGELDRVLFQNYFDIMVRLTCT